MAPGISLLFLSGCAHYYLPAGQLESPEALGPDRVARLEIITIQSGTDLVGESQRQAKDPETGKTPNPVLQMQPLNYAFGATVAVRPELEVGIRFQPFAPLLARAKYQFYGEPESEAKRGNLSAAAALNAGMLLGSYEGDTVTFYSTQAALIGGWRFGTHHLASLAPFFNLAGISGVGPADSSGSRMGACLGYQYDNESLVLRAEVTWATGTLSRKLEGDVSPGGIFPGASLGFRL
jgi:hypothetical protein